MVKYDAHCITSSNPVAGESGLDRFACGVGGKAVFPHVHRTVPLMLKNGQYIEITPFYICAYISEL